MLIFFKTKLLLSYFQDRVYLNNFEQIAATVDIVVYQFLDISWTFSFEVKFYPPDICVLQEEVTR